MLQEHLAGGERAGRGARKGGKGEVGEEAPVRGAEEGAVGRAAAAAVEAVAEV